MLPMVYRNLHSEGLDDSELTQLKSVYRQFWLRTRLTLRSASQGLAALRAAGVEPVALKGLGLMATAYLEPATRPMHDLDFLIAPGDVQRAFDALAAIGWRPLHGSREHYFRTLRTFHALPVIGPDGIELDLHRFMLEENCFAEADDRLRRRIRESAIDGMRVTVPSPEDQVINACVHGVRWDPVPPLRWVIDAVMAIRSTGAAFEWDYLEGESVERGVSLAMAAALDFARQFEPSIPATTVEALASGPHKRIERWDFRAQQAGYSAFGQVGRYLTRYLRLSSRRRPQRRLREFPVYLAAMWELDSPRTVPLEGVRRVWRAARR